MRRWLNIKIAVFPGYFEPITLKHLNILKRALKLFDKIIVLVLNNPLKKSIISVPNRLELIKMATEGLNIEADYWENLLVDYAEVVGACALIKEIKNTNSSKELEIFDENEVLNSSVETVFFAASSKYRHISSELILKMAAHKKSLISLVPTTIETKLIKILSEV